MSPETSTSRSDVLRVRHARRLQICEETPCRPVPGNTDMGRRSSMPTGFHSLREPELTLAKRCQVRRSATANKIDFEVVSREIRGCLAREEGSALPGKIRRVLRASNGSANIHDAAVAIAIVRIFNRMHYV